MTEKSFGKAVVAVLLKDLGTLFLTILKFFKKDGSHEGYGLLPSAKDCMHLVTTE